MATFTYIENGALIEIQDTASTRSDVVTEYQAVFATPDNTQPLNTDSETIVGQLIDAETSSRQSVARNNATLANQMNPDLATGDFLDAIMALSGISRRPPTKTIVLCEVYGTTGTTLPSGVKVSNTNGDVFSMRDPLSFENSLHDNVVFEADVPGPVVVTAGDLTNIVNPELYPNLTRITNPTAGTTGRPLQSDIDAKTERKRKIAVQGRRTSLAIISGVLSVSGVKSVSFLENSGDVTIPPNSTPYSPQLAPHSIWLCVHGGADDKVVEAIMEYKSAGVNLNGTSSTIVYTEPYSGQVYSIANSNPVKFDRPTEVEISVEVTVNGDNQNIAETLQEWGSYALKLNMDVTPFLLACVVRDLLDYDVITVRVAKKPMSGPPSWSTEVIIINANEVATIAANDVVIING